MKLHTMQEFIMYQTDVHGCGVSFFTVFQAL